MTVCRQADREPRRLSADTIRTRAARAIDVTPSLYRRNPCRHPAGPVLTAMALLLALCAGCATPWGAPRPVQYENDGVRQLMDQLQAVNTDLEGFKALGRVTLSARGSERTFERTVWAAAPGRLRFAFRAPTGLPILSMSCDQQWVTALQHAEGDYHRRPIGSGSLSSYLPVSISCADLYQLFVGRPPEVSYDAVIRDPAAENAPQEIVLLLKRRFRGTVGRLRLNQDTGDLKAVELFDVHGHSQYEARLEEMQVVGGYRLPSRIRLAGPKGWLALQAARLWPLAAPEASLFQIPPPAQ